MQVKEEGWWLVLGDVSTHELLALKRLSFRDITTTRLTFPVTNGAGKTMSEVTLFFVSDSYQGLDQQYTVPVKVHQKPVQQHRQHQGRQHQVGKHESGADAASSQQAAISTTAAAEQDDSGSIH